MRKLLAVVMAVLMLTSVLAALPASAVEYNTSTSTDAGTLSITEFGTQLNAGSTSSAGALNYIELYNGGTADINLNDISLVMSPDYISAPKISKTSLHPYRRSDDDKTYMLWREEHKFLSKIDIKEGDILDETEAAKYVTAGKFNTHLLDGKKSLKLNNAGQDMTLSQGETVVVWMINQNTINWLNTKYTSTGYDPRHAFKEIFYKNNASEKNMTILMVWAYDNYVPYEKVEANALQSIATDMFKFETPNTVTSGAIESYMYGVVVDSATDPWDLKTDVAWDWNTGAWNANVLAVASWGTQMPYNYSGHNNPTKTAAFVPSIAKPELYNAYNKFIAKEGETVTEHADYYAAGLVKNYREMAFVHMGEDPTPGEIPAWQKAYLTGDTSDAAKAAIKAFLDSFGYTGVDEEANAEDKIDVKPPSQEELKDRYYGEKEEKKDDKKGLPTLVLILIIVGGVLVVGGGVTAVLLFVVLPKKKAKAAAAAAAEAAPAEEPAKEEAPAAEDKPAEEAPAAEDKPAEEAPAAEDKPAEE